MYALYYLTATILHEINTCNANLQPTFRGVKNLVKLLF